MNFKNLFYSTYWFKQPVIATRGVYYAMLGVLLGMFVIGVLGRYLSSKTEDTIKKKLLFSSGEMFAWLGSAGLILFFFRQQSVPLLGWRIWFLFWAIILAAWSAKILRYALKRAPAIKSEQAEKAILKKYLPEAK